MNQSEKSVSEEEKAESCNELNVEKEMPEAPENKAMADHVKELERQIRLLKIENEYLKELRSLRNAQKPKSNESISIIIHILRGSFQLSEILEAVKFPKSTYMYWQKRFGRSDPDEELKQLIKDIRAVHKDYGHKRVKMELLKRGYIVNKKKVQRLLVVLDLRVTSYTRKSRKYSSYKGKVGTVCDNLNRRFKTSVARQKVTTDTTEFKYDEVDERGIVHQRKAYLNPFLDLYYLEIMVLCQDFGQLKCKNLSYLFCKSFFFIFIWG